MALICIGSVSAADQNTTDSDNLYSAVIEESSIELNSIPSDEIESIDEQTLIEDITTHPTNEETSLINNGQSSDKLSSSDIESNLKVSNEEETIKDGYDYLYDENGIYYDGTISGTVINSQDIYKVGDTVTLKLANKPKIVDVSITL